MNYFGEVSRESQEVQRFSFRLVNRHLFFYFSFHAFWISGRIILLRRITQWISDFSFSSSFWSTSLRASLCLTKGKMHPFCWSPNILGNAQTSTSAFFILFVFILHLSFIFTVKHQEFSSYIEIDWAFEDTILIK